MAFFVKNLHKLDRLPDNLKEQIFERVFEVAEIAKFSHEEYLSYEDSLKYYRDLKNTIDTAKEEGREEGREKRLEEGMEKKAIEIAKEMLAEKEPIEKIIRFTGLTLRQIETLK